MTTDKSLSRGGQDVRPFIDLSGVVLVARTKNNQKNNNGAKLGFEETLWLAADKQRGTWTRRSINTLSWG